MPGSISEADLVAALKALAADLGRQPTRAEMESQGLYSATPYYRQFGSWPAALQQAGLEPEYRQDIAETELVAALRELATELERRPRPQDMAAQGPFSPSTYRRRFGSWADACAEADLADLAGDDAGATRIDRVDLLRALYSLTRELGRPPTQTDMDALGPYSVDIYHDRFGSWDAALAEADLQLE